MYFKALILLFLAEEFLPCNCLAKNLPVLRSTDLEHLVQYRQWEKPICVLFLNSNETVHYNSSSMPNPLLQPSLVEKAVRSLQRKGRCNGWVFGKLYTYQEDSSSRISVPAFDGMLRCYLGTSAPIDYEKGTTVKKWLGKMVKIHEDRLHSMTSDSLDKLFQENLATELYIVVLPGNYFFEVIEKVLIKVRKNCISFCKVVIVPPESQQERKLSEKYEIRIYPTILLFHRKKKGMMPVLRKRLEGIHSVNDKENILLAVLIIRLHAIVLTSENFASNALNTRWKTSPLVVCFFSSSNSASYSYLYAFQRTVSKYSDDQNLKGSLRFGLVDIAVPENANLISRHLDVTEIKKIPFISVFWQSPALTDSLSRFEIRNRIIPDLTPTPWNLEVMLRALNIQNETTELPSKRRVDLFCSVNSTQMCSIGDFPAIFYGPIWDPTYKAKKPLKKTPLFKKLHGIPLLTDKLWGRIMEQTSPGKVSSKHFFKKEEKIQAVKLVIFIMADCGFCEIIMPSFGKLAKAAKRIHGVSVYLMNCTANPIQCKANGVTGYPTLALFRSVSEEESRNCVLENSTSSSVRLDYHGVIQIEDILSWLSKASMSAVNMYIKTNSIAKMKKDVRLTAHLYTRAQSRKYLSRSLQQKLIPFQCFKLACEKLFGTVECVARRSSDVETEREWNEDIKEKDFVIERVEFERIDGVKATIFKLNFPMENTMAEERGPGLHTFHRKHRYSIPGGFKCENDHPLCTHILVRFVEDHLRLPITHITREGFHIHSPTSSIFSKEFPLLIALVHKENITGNSSFLQELNKAAKNLYTKMMFATLNVDEFPSWASQFVPRDYHYKNRDVLHKIPALYHYPRICIIDWSDHQHAAFYPSITSLEKSKNVRKILSNIFAKDIVKFAERYLDNRESMTIQTEMF